MSEQEDHSKRIHRSGKDYPTPGVVRQLDPGRVLPVDAIVGPNLADPQNPEGQGAIGGLPPANVLQPLIPPQADN